jgi:putative ABC transport system ATP-binding protein
MAEPTVLKTSKPSRNGAHRRKVIVAKNVKKTFKVGNEPYPAVRGISVEMYDAEFIIIYGPSGSGKSTFLNTIIGLERPTEGEIWVDGIEIDKMNDDQRAQMRVTRIGVVAQQPIWVKALTVLDNVAMPLLIANHKEKDAYQRARESLKQVGLLDWSKHKAAELSGGQQQRVNLARALVNNPHILVLDEPTGNLDTQSAIQVLRILQDLNRQHRRTVIMVTHNLDYLPLADRTVMIRDGKIEKVTENKEAMQI